MKITHICLGAFYIDNYSYQENIITKYHKKLGYDVTIIASTLSFDKDGKSTNVRPSKYYNENNIKVNRLGYALNVPKKISKFLRLYKNLYKALEENKPDIIFIHGCQFLDIREVVRYIKNYPEVIVYVDNHADFSNSATNWLSKNILHKIIWRKTAQLIEPYTTKFYGVLPARVDFLEKIYKVPKEKVELLVMGADDEEVEFASQLVIIKELREKHNIKQDDFLIVTGGKIDNAKKQTLQLMQAVKNISNKMVKLLVFGSVVPELKEKFEKLIDGEKIQYIGWIESKKSYQYFAAADLIIFPGRHSVFWEQAVGQGIPMVVKWWEGTTHIDLGGNVKFLYNDSTEEIFELITEIISNKKLYRSMKIIAEKDNQQFLYSNIAKKSLDII